MKEDTDTVMNMMSMGLCRLLSLRGSGKSLKCSNIDETAMLPSQ